MADPVNDAFTDRIEEKVRNLLLADSGLADLKGMYRGEPPLVPTEYYPFGFLFVTEEREANGELGMGRETGGINHWRYNMTIAFEVLLPDIEIIPDANRKNDVPSYVEVRRMVQVARRVLRGWGERGVLTTDPVISADGSERSFLLVMGGVRNGLQARGSTNVVSNASSLSVAIYSRKQE